ncbi:copper resistance system multicopper oxidase [Hyphomonas sp.]|uniref:copper resistance system multicopper oxidase n=1 Tax=Hyphomonas sp. TaxID=87 RepID=UPI0030FA6CA4
MISRRKLLKSTLATGTALSAASLLPAWARSFSDGNTGLPTLAGTTFDLSVGKFPIRINGRAGEAIGVNGTVPAPLLRFREGDEITLNVKNNLEVDTSIHWHGLLVPFYMDGVPGVSFPGIKPGETFQYKFAVPQNGTYWYHSHSGLQEQLGHYGPIIIDPKGPDPISCDREYILVLSDWSFESPHRIFSKLKKHSDTYNYNQRTVGDFMNDASKEGIGATLADRAMWGQMRMSPMDLADVTGATYTYLINGHSTADNWNAVFQPGERVRLRIINASAMTLFNFRIPGLSMTVVASDGLHVQPVETDEFQIGVAETYDVIVQPTERRAYSVVAESIDRSGLAIATLAPNIGMRAEVPDLRTPMPLTMTDMGMSGMDHSSMGGMDHSAMGHDMLEGMDETSMIGMEGMEMPGMDHSVQMDMLTTVPDVKSGPGNTGLAMMPVSRLDEPGHGLSDVGHRVLRYSQLRSLDPNPDLRPPEREIELHLTSNMERYMWSFNGVRFSYIDAPIVFHEGERVRLNLINDTMMPHPIHLHGMFFDLVNEGDDHKPRKHTVIVKPGEKLSVDISAEHVGDWAFHCHLLYHMHAGMMQVVSILPKDTASPMMMDHSQMEGVDHSQMDHGTMDHSMMDMGEDK